MEHNFFYKANHWQCECGAIGNAFSPDWRWNGKDWEHHHGYPIVHVTAKRIKSSYLSCNDEINILKCCNEFPHFETLDHGATSFMCLTCGTQTSYCFNQFGSRFHAAAKEWNQIITEKNSIKSSLMDKDAFFGKSLTVY